jgi:quercetin dioxygenase-like cupin family protein
VPLDERLRPPPSVRAQGSELPFDLGATAKGLREEAHPVRDGHRQIGLLHQEHIRLVLFAFDKGGRLPKHEAPGLVTIQVLSGRLRVSTPKTTHHLGTGHLLVLERDVAHGIEALDQSDVLLTVHLDGERSGAP